jgi:hypothetical protein
MPTPVNGLAVVLPLAEALERDTLSELGDVGIEIGSERGHAALNLKTRRQRRRTSMRCSTCW